ncbi:MAG: hypothetical protein LBF93_08125 [Zoogloeaceae bacterium]|nr:hypothetical protein [Zoogloeaceae bacterium]
MADIRTLMGARTCEADEAEDEAGYGRLALTVLFDLAPEEIWRLTEEETARLMAASVRLNPDFFSGDPATDGLDVHADVAMSVIALEKAVARIVTRGHVNA